MYDDCKHKMKMRSKYSDGCYSFARVWILEVGPGSLVLAGFCMNLEGEIRFIKATRLSRRGPSGCRRAGMDAEHDEMS